MIEQTANSRPTSPPPQRGPVEPRALRILAKSIYRELKAQGYERGDIVALTTELLDVLSADIRESQQPPIS